MEEIGIFWNEFMVKLGVMFELSFEQWNFKYLIYTTLLEVVLEKQNNLIWILNKDNKIDLETPFFSQFCRFVETENVLFLN